MGEWAYLGLAVVLLICLSYFVFAYARKQEKVSRIVGYGVAGLIVLVLMAGFIFIAAPSLRSFVVGKNEQGFDNQNNIPKPFVITDLASTKGMQYFMLNNTNDWFMTGYEGGKDQYISMYWKPISAFPYAMVSPVDWPEKLNFISKPLSIGDVPKKVYLRIYQDVIELLSKNITARDTFVQMLKQSPEAYNALLKELGLKK